VESQPNWPRARLIPVSGIGSQKEAETRAASAVLAVLSVVRDLSVLLFSPMGASRASRAVVDLGVTGVSACEQPATAPQDEPSEHG
jgi:predicted component of type VI protein secretion system